MRETKCAKRISYTTATKKEQPNIKTVLETDLLPLLREKHTRIHTHTHGDENNIPSDLKKYSPKSYLTGFIFRISQNQHLSNLKMHYGSHTGVRTNDQNSSER